MPIRLRVKEIANQKNISQRQLFFLSHVDPNVIRKVFKDPYANVTMVTLGRLADALGVDPRELIDGNANGEKPHDEEPPQEDKGNSV